MEMSCPGRQDRNLDSQVVRCPECGAPVEIFSDEQKARCRCGNVILREALPSCISWCPAAERCLGQIIDIREVRKRIEAMRREGGSIEYVRKIGEKIEKSRHKDEPVEEDSEGTGLEPQ